MSVNCRDLDYTVDVLTQPEPVTSIDELDAKKYGVIVQAGYRRGLLLPDLEGVDTPPAADRNLPPERRYRTE